MYVIVCSMSRQNRLSHEISMLVSCITLNNAFHITIMRSWMLVFSLALMNASVGLLSDDEKGTKLVLVACVVFVMG